MFDWSEKTSKVVETQSPWTPLVKALIAWDGKNKSDQRGQRLAPSKWSVQHREKHAPYCTCPHRKFFGHVDFAMWTCPYSNWTPRKVILESCLKWCTRQGIQPGTVFEVNIVSHDLWHLYLKIFIRLLFICIIIISYNLLTRSNNRFQN